jgi:hypothetical protein
MSRQANGAPIAELATELVELARRLAAIAETQTSAETADLNLSRCDEPHWGGRGEN